MIEVPSFSADEFELALSAEQLADIVNNKMRFVDFNPRDAYNRLSENNKAALVHLVKAASILDDVFLKQDHPDNIRIREALRVRAETGNLVDVNALEVFTMHNGIEAPDMYTPKTIPLHLMKHIQQSTIGAGLYPSDVTQQEIIDYIVAHPEQAAEILNNNTIIVRDSEGFAALAYSVAFANEMQGAAKELRAAAEKTDHAGFATYLRLQADALINDTDTEAVFEAEKAWITLDERCPLEFTISRESYEDLFSARVASAPAIEALIKEHKIDAQQKDLLGIRVGIVSQQSEKQIAAYRSNFDYFAQTLPGRNRYPETERETEAPKQFIVDIDIVCLAGDLAACRGGMVIANNLPNPDKLSVKRGVGYRQTFHRQIRSGADPTIQAAMLDALLVPEQHALFDITKRFQFTLGHEGGHPLGPRTTIDGRDKGSALGAAGAMLEENKADLISVTMAEYLLSIGKMTAKDVSSLYVTWIINQLPTKQPADSEAHRSREIIQLNYFIEHGVIKQDVEGRFGIALNKVAPVARQMLTEVIDLQLDGDADKAQSFVKRYGYWGHNLQQAAVKIMQLQPKLYRCPRQILRDELLALWEEAPVVPAPASLPNVFPVVHP